LGQNYPIAAWETTPLAHLVSCVRAQHVSPSRHHTHAPFLLHWRVGPVLSGPSPPWNPKTKLALCPSRAPVVLLPQTAEQNSGPASAASRSLPVGPICRAVSVFLAWPVLFLPNSTRAARGCCNERGRDHRKSPAGCRNQAPWTLFNPPSHRASGKMRGAKPRKEIGRDKRTPPPSNRAYALGRVSPLGVGASTRSLGVARGLTLHDWIAEHQRLLVVK
jgi:hypothetical protein